MTSLLLLAGNTVVVAVYSFSHFETNIYNLNYIHTIKPGSIVDIQRSQVMVFKKNL